MDVSDLTESDLIKMAGFQESRAVMEDGSIRMISGVIGTREGRVTVTIPKSETGGKILHIDLLPDLMNAKTGEGGYIVTIGGIHEGNFLTYYKERGDMEYVTNFTMMPVFGIRKSSCSVLAIATGMAADVKTVTGVRDGTYYIYPRFSLEGDEAYEDITVEYAILPAAGYSEMAAYYRNYQLSRGACVPLKERAAANPELKRAAESVEVRIRNGWKPSPSPILHQTPETQPPMKVACDFDKVSAIISEFKRQGVGKAEFCLVGWNSGGHDGRFPQLFPAEERLGGEEKLRKAVREAKEAGYNIVCHTNNTCSYECADSWSWDLPLVKKDGSYMLGGSLSGGQRYYICPQVAFDRYASADLPKVAEIGFKGLHFIDVLTAEPAKKCSSEKHKVNRKQCVALYNKMAALSRELFGGFASEGPYDFLCGNTDYMMYVTINGKDRMAIMPIFDENIPFWQLVYHGIILSNPDSTTVNYTMKGADEQLRLIETGGRPIMYYYSKFGEKKNWMGDIDLMCDTGEELVKSVAYVKQAYDEYKALVHLQYEFMERHEKLSEGIYRITYSDGTTIRVDYNAGTYEVASQ